MIRELPRIDIGGTEFFLDLRLNEFRQVDNFMNRIDLDDLFETKDGYALCFDKTNKCLFAGSEGEFASRNDLVRIDLPSLEVMDPVGWDNLVNQWKNDNPVLTALIQQLPVVLQNREKTTIGELMKEKPRLFEKKNLRNRNGLRQ